MLPVSAIGTKRTSPSALHVCFLTQSEHSILHWRTLAFAQQRTIFMV